MEYMELGGRLTLMRGSRWNAEVKANLSEMSHLGEIQTMKGIQTRKTQPISKIHKKKRPLIKSNLT
jgi:hypothetical protein